MTKSIDIFFKSYKLSSLPSKSKSLIYLGLVLLTALLIFTNFKLPFMQYITIQMYLVILGVILGFNDLKIYFKKVKSWKHTFKISFFLYLIKSLFNALGIFLLNTNDPQGLSNLVIKKELYLLKMLNLPFIAFGEEFLKVLMFLAFLSLINLPWKYRLIISIIVSSFIFGLLHANYKITVILPIALGAIPTYFFLVKYKSIYPLIIVHFVWDGLFIHCHLEHYGELFKMCSYMIISIIIYIRVFTNSFRDLKDIFGNNNFF